MTKPHTVVAILEAKPEKGQELESALKAIVTPSRAEKANLEYRLHKSKDNPLQFFLYENWVDGEKHQEQFSKPYITDLVSKLDDLLAKPFQAIFAEEIETA
jgi:quinol monooxygenase YgiN